MFILLWLPDTDRRCLVSLYQIIVFKIQSDSLEAALPLPSPYGTRAELLARMGCCSAGRPVPPSYPLAPPGASLVWPARPAGRNPVPVDLFSHPAIQPNFPGPVQRRHRRLSKSPAATFALERAAFASDGHSRLPAFPPADAKTSARASARRTSGSGVLWSTATGATFSRRAGG